MSKTTIATDNAPNAIGPYSQAVIIGNTCYVSGQIPVNPKTGEMAEGIENQTKQCLENISAILKAGGYDLKDALKTTVYMTDLSMFSVMNEVYGKYFISNPPARSTVEVSGLPKGALIEIDVIASK